MPGMCVAFNCDNKGGHRFPKDKDLRKKWIVAIKRLNFSPSSESRVCRDHFKEDDYVTFSSHTDQILAKRLLKKDAVPSQFSWKRKLDASFEEARRLRSIQRENRIKCRVNMPVVRPVKDSSSSIPVEESVLDPIISLDQGDCPLNVMDISIGCEVEVASDLNVCNLNVDMTDMKKNKLSDIKSFANSSTQTVFISCGFTLEKLRYNQEGVRYYTGFECFDKLKLVLYSLGPAAYELSYRYREVENMLVEDQFLMTVIKLRRAIPDMGLSLLFDVSKKTVQNIVVTWINFMYCEWASMDIWPTKDLIKYYMPSGFKQTYPSTRVIVDGTEFPINAPQNPKFRQAAFSTYKNKCTLQSMVGASPGGLISYVSPAFAGSVSDRAIVERSDLVSKCDPGDSVMADRGFTVQDLFAPRQVSVNMPAFLKGKSQLPGMTLLKDRKLASKRVHIERIIGLVKTYRILKHELPGQFVPLGSEIFYVCCMLCNFRECIVSVDA